MYVIKGLSCGEYYVKKSQYNYTNWTQNADEASQFATAAQAATFISNETDRIGSTLGPVAIGKIVPKQQVEYTFEEVV